MGQHSVGQAIPVGELIDPLALALHCPPEAHLPAVGDGAEKTLFHRAGGRPLPGLQLPIQDAPGALDSFSSSASESKVERTSYISSAAASRQRYARW